MSDNPKELIFLFIGVSTAQSSSVASFPKWMELLGRPEVKMEGVDFALDDEPERYRATLERMRSREDVLGGLVTSHKISLVEAGRDLFDELTPFAEMLGEVSCIYKRDSRLIGETMDAHAGGAALRDEIGHHYFRNREASVLILGAGGAATGLSLDLLTRPDPSDRPGNLILVDRSRERLQRIDNILRSIDHDARVDLFLHDKAEENDALVAELPDGSVVINATGMGKDTPGSPVTDGVRFPAGGRIWELNYRGPRKYLVQAREQASSRGLYVFDGWGYFIRGWSSIIGRVLDVEIDAELRKKMGRAARTSQ